MDCCGPQSGWSLTDTVSRDLSAHLNSDISPVLSWLVLLLRYPETACKELLGFLEIDAQALLDILQDVSLAFSVGFNKTAQLLDHVSSPSVRPSIFSALWRLSRAYGLYPTCFALTGVKLIRQFSITGRGFGDIYKAVLAGQLVSVKRLRMFEYSRVPAKVGQT
jgi:hypothetical protein